MRLAIMQPYILPYIGYFQLIRAVDEFIIYDNIQFTKKGWINRNRILVNGSDAYVTLPLKKDSDFLHIKDRYLAESWPAERSKLLARISGAYRRAPYFSVVFPLMEQIIGYEDHNLFEFIRHSLTAINQYLDITTPLVVSSTIPIDHSLKADQKVIALCKARNASEYINPIGGLALYDKSAFLEEGITLSFLQTGAIEYPQTGSEFIPFLSIIDVLMFNKRADVQAMLEDVTYL